MYIKEESAEVATWPWPGGCRPGDMTIKSLSAGADDEKEGSGNGFLRDLYLSLRNYNFDDSQLLKSLTAFSKENSKHSDFVETLFEISYDSDKHELATKFVGSVEKLMEGHKLREKPVELSSGSGAAAADAMDIEAPSGSSGRGGRSKRQRT